MADLVTIAVTAALTQFVGPGFKHLGEQALERAKQVAGKATSLLGAVGREPQPVEPKLLLPLVQGAGLETDPAITELWAALLANAADPAQRITVQVGFIDVLRQLQPADTLVLNRLYLYPSAEGTKIGSNHGLIDSQVFQLLGYEDGRLALDNLTRLRLCREGERLSNGFPFWATEYGFRFMQAVSPPTL